MTFCALARSDGASGADRAAKGERYGGVEEVQEEEGGVTRASAKCVVRSRKHSSLDDFVFTLATAVRDACYCVSSAAAVLVRFSISSSRASSLETRRPEIELGAATRWPAEASDWRRSKRDTADTVAGGCGPPTGTLVVRARAPSPNRGQVRPRTPSWFGVKC